MWYNEGSKILSPSAMVEHPRAVYLVRRYTMPTTLSPRVLKNKSHFVYELVDPRDDMPIFYVGITQDLYRRFKDHMGCDGTNVQKDRRTRKR